jgi:CHAT domain-containing protein
LKEAENMIIKGDYNKVPQLMDSILVLAEKIEDIETRFIIYGISIQRYISAKYYQNAINLSKESIQKSQKHYGDKHKEVAYFLHCLGFSYANDGQLQNAITYEKKAIEILEELGEYDEMYVMLISLLTNYYNESEQYSESIKTLKHSLSVIDATIAPASILAIIYRSIGLNYEMLGNFSMALKYTEKALELHDKSPQVYLPLKIHYAYLCSQHCDYERAQQVIDEVSEEAKKGDLIELYLESILTKANILLDSKDNNHLVLALKLAELCTGFYEANYDISEKYINSLMTLADAYGQLGLLDKKQEVYSKIYDIKGQNKDVELDELAFSSFMCGKYNESLSYFKELAKNVSQQKGEDCYEYADIELHMALISIVLGNVSDAAIYFKNSFPKVRNEIINSFYLLNDKERHSFWKKFNRFFNETMPITCYKTNDSDIAGVMYDMTLLSKGILLNTEIAMREMEDKKSSAELLGKGLDIKWKDVQKRLGADDIAIEFIHFCPMDSVSIYMALSLRKDSKYPKTTILFEKEQLQEVADTLYYLYDAMYNLVWKPMQSELNGVNNIYFSPSGVLHKIGIEYLPGMEEYNIFRLSSTRELVNKRDINGNHRAVLYGGLDYDTKLDSISRKRSLVILNETFKERANVRGIGLRGGKEYLKHTKIEVDRIGEELNKVKYECLLDTASLGTEESFKLLSGKKINTLHIATHGFYYTKEETDDKGFQFMLLDDQKASAEDKALTRTGLVMSGANHILEGEKLPDNVEDGILTAKEIADVDLRGLDLVVLSACQTGLGDISQGEGVFGLQRGFKKAGANSILMSLWEVEDEATQILMTQFYKNLVSGQSKRQSLRSAQRYLRQYNAGQYDKPEYWAAFILLDGIENN